MAFVLEDLQSRLNEFITTNLGLSVRRFEETCGLSNGVLAASKAKGPTSEILSKILDTYPDLNLNWLIAGRGPMLIQGQPLPTPQNDIHHNQVFIANWGDLRGVIEDVIAKNK